MATLRQRLHRKNASGSYDLVHFETEASLVIMPDGSNLATWKPFVAAASAPSDTRVFWIDTRANNGLKYHNGSAWVAVPVMYT